MVKTTKTVLHSAKLLARIVQAATNRITLLASASLARLLLQQLSRTSQRMRGRMLRLLPWLVSCPPCWQSFISTPENAAPLIQALRESTLAPVTTLPIPHYVFNEQEQIWKQQPPSPPPVITVSASLDRQAYGQLQLNPPRLTKRAGAGHCFVLSL